MAINDVQNCSVSKNATLSGSHMASCGAWASITHDDVIKWKHYPYYSPFVRGIHRSPVDAPHKGQWRGALMFSTICTPEQTVEQTLKTLVIWDTHTKHPLILDWVDSYVNHPHKNNIHIRTDSIPKHTLKTYFMKTSGNTSTSQKHFSGFS